MSKVSNQDPRIAEVRRALEDVQRLSGELADSFRDDPSKEPLPITPWPDRGGALTVTVQTEPERVLQGRRAVFAGAAVLGVAAVGAGLWIMTGSLRQPAVRQPATVASTSAAVGTVSSPAAQAALPPDSPLPASAVGPNASSATPASAASTPVHRPAEPASSNSTRSTGAGRSAVLSSAAALIAQGKVADARAALMAADPHSDPDVALALARSFDPRHLKSGTVADAGPDAERAAEWYGIWHQTALAKGMISDTVSLDRLLRGLR